MSLTTCIRKAGAVLSSEDKSAIQSAARAYRKQGLSADDAGRRAVADRIAAVEGMLAEAMKAKPQQDAAPVESRAGEAAQAAIKPDAKPAGATAAENGKEPKRDEYPLGKTDREDRFFGTRVRVLPDLKGDTAWEGTIQSTLNGGRLFTVKRGDSDARPRISGNRLEVLEVKDAEKPASPAKAPATINMLPLAQRWSALVEHTKEDGGDPDKGQRSYRALTQFVGRGYDKPADVWDRWSSFIGSTDLVNRSAAEVVKWMESNLPTMLDGYARSLPGASMGSTNAGDVSYWQKNLAELERREHYHNRYVNKLEQQVADVEELGGDEGRIDTARKVIAGINRQFASNRRTIQQGLQEAERREKQEAAEREAAEAARYKPFDAKELSKKPTPASMSGWFTGTYEGKTVWTQGAILDASGTPPHLAGYESRLDTLGRNKDGKLNVGRVIPQNKGVPAVPFAYYDGVFASTAKDGVVYLNAGGDLVGVNATFFRYFASKFKGVSYFSSAGNAAITVQQDGKTVGVIMPIRLTGKDGATPTVADIQAKIGQAPAAAKQPKDFRSSADSTSERERDLRKLSHDDERPGDVMLGNDKFVTMEQAKAAAQAAIDDGELNPAAPFQYNRVLDIAPRDWERMVKEMTGKAYRDPTRGGRAQEEAAQPAAASEPAEAVRAEPSREDRRRAAAEAVRKATVERTNANSAMVWQIIGPDGNPMSGPPGKYPGNDGPLAGTATMGDLGWKTKREADAALAELNRVADEILGAATRTPSARSVDTSPERVQKEAGNVQTADPDALTLTPKQYHDAKLRAISESTGTTLAEVREVYDTEAGRAANDQEWVDRVVRAAQSGTLLTRATLDKLLDLRPTTRLPETAVPSGYQRPEARKAEAEAAEAKREDRRKLKARAEAPAPRQGVAPMPAIPAISMSLAQQAHAGTSFTPERRAEQERDSFHGALRDAWDRAARIAGADEAAIARITEVFDDVADGYAARFSATLQARSRVMSSMITGPARFPVERNRKRMETERKRAEEAQQYLDRGIKRLIRAARGPIDNSPESELERVRLNLGQREESQEQMKAANAALRKGDDAALEDLGFTAEQIAELKKPDFAGRTGFPDYRLANNNAEIRRLRERLKDAEARVAAAASGPTETERAGVRVVEDAQDDRLRLVFDGKPSEEVRSDLKAAGFKWSPKNEAWQRQLTANAKYAAQQVLDKHFPADTAGNVAMLSRAIPRVTVIPDESGLPTYNYAGIRIEFPQEAVRFEVKPDEGSGEVVVNYAIMSDDSFEAFGFVDLLMRDGVPVSLIDIAIQPEYRGTGAGRKVVEALLAAHPDNDLNISNIVEGARGFWAKMGVFEQNREAGAAYDGTLNWEIYAQAQDGSGALGGVAGSRAASPKRDTRAEEGGRRQNRQAQSGGLTLVDAQALASAIRAGGGPRINVARTVADMPADKRDSVLSVQPNGKVRGVYFRGDDTIWAVTENLRSAEEFAFVVMHEAFHRGIAKTLGPEAKRVLRQMYLTNGRLNRLTKEQMKRHGIGEDEAIEEALADLAGEGVAADLRGWDKLLKLIRDWLGKMADALGIQMTWTDEMVETFIAGIYKAGVEGDAVGVLDEVPDSFFLAGAGTPDGAMLSRAPTAQTLNNLRDTQLPAGYIVNDFIKSTGRLSWWSKTVGTMHNLAENSPEFKRVYDAAQRFLGDVSLFATEAADLAPSLLPKLETIRDIRKAPLSAADTKAISAPIFQGTLSWARDEQGKPVKIDTLKARAEKMPAEDKAREMLRTNTISENVLKMWQGLPVDQYEAAVSTRYEREVLKAGVVWSDDELKSMFGLNTRQIGLYREFRASTDKSLESLAISDMLRFGGKDTGAIASAALATNDVDKAAEMLRDHLYAMAEATPDRADVLNDTAEKMIDKAERARDLMKRGYAPLTRYGHYTLDVVDEQGERVYFGLFESQAEANKMARDLAREFPKASIQQGTLSERAYQMFAGVSPETLELFGDMLGLDSQGDAASAQAFQQYLKLAKSNRSAMKRLIERKGIAGFSEDAGRVLAGFVTSNARQTSKNLHFGEITEATQSIAETKGKGELLDAAVDLHQFITNPREEAQKIKGLMFAQFLGGSIASAMVNMTQPLTVTFPYLTQFGGVAKAAARMRGALKLAVAWELADPGKRTTGDAKLDAAMKLAEEQGIVSPQEIHHLMAQAGGAGSLKAGDGTRAGDAAAKASNFLSKTMLAWGRPFAVAEQFNRRTTFIAAYRTAVEQGMSDPGAFAAKTIADTQFVYNKGNRPVWARGAIGSTLFTFKTYSISYVELMTRLAKSGPEGRRAALVGIAILALMSGLQGLPGADDLDDLIDGAMQRLGYNFNSKTAKREALAAILGEGGAMFVLKGVSGLPGLPIDVSGRMGLSNLIPGTGLLTKKDDYTRDAMEVLGPVGSFAQQIGKGAAKLAEGEIGGAIHAVLPVAAANAAKAADMAATGMYRNEKGQKVIDVDGIEAVFKAIGFQPNDVARVQQATGEVQRMIALTKIRETEIADKWARGMFEQDQDLIQEARDELARWNESNPDTRIKITSAQLIKRLVSMRQDKAQRIAGTAPKEIRGTVRAELERVQ